MTAESMTTATAPLIESGSWSLPESRMSPMDSTRAAGGLARSAAAPIATYPQSSLGPSRPVPSKGTASNVAYDLKDSVGASEIKRGDHLTSSSDNTQQIVPAKVERRRKAHVKIQAPASKTGTCGSTAKSPPSIR